MDTWDYIADAFTQMLNTTRLTYVQIDILNLYYADEEAVPPSFSSIVCALQLNYSADVTDIINQIRQSLIHIFTRSQEEFPEVMAFLLASNNPRAAGSELCASRKQIAELQKQVEELTSDNEKPGLDIVTEDTLLYLLCKPIGDLHFAQYRSRIYNCLKAENIDYVVDLVQRTDTWLKKTPNLGKKSVQEISRALEVINLSLGMTFAPEFISQIESKLNRIKYDDNI